MVVAMVGFYGFMRGVGVADEIGLAVYGGRMTADKWTDSIGTDATFVDAWIFVTAVSSTLIRLFEDQLSIELEGQAGRYFGDQDHWEFNLPIAARWHRFPWDRQLSTSFAWGVGPSYATELPQVEEMINSGSQQWLIYWFAELTAGPPRARWEALIRLHHRSGAFGVVTNNGGSNTVCAGLRFRY